ncbi:MAG TPA: hypothetical protein VMU07_01495 [Candidatus Paceibacterota bacterium]|nr:hypothetical protein [Candidatus Paceibacterota bacterium]
MVAFLTAVVLFLLLLVFLAVIAALALSWKSALAIIIQTLIRNEMFFDQIPEGYATAYESGGEFFALACSQRDFGPVKAPGDLDWAIRRKGSAEKWPEWVDDEGRMHTAEDHMYIKDDFYWDRRPKLIKKIFGEHTGVVWMGIWPMAKPKYYDLRINNFRTVKPSDSEVKEKQADVREYKINGEIVGWLISWTERTKRVLLSDDSYPFPIDGLRVGACLTGSKKQQSILVNLLLFIRGRIQEPYLFLYRGQDTFEIIQNEVIQHTRQLTTGMSIDECLAFGVTLESDKDQTNMILAKNAFGSYIRSRYGFAAKGASFGPIDIPGDAGVALSAPFVARQNAEALAETGRGEAEREAAKLRVEGEEFAKLVDKIGYENAMGLRVNDAAESFAKAGNSTVVLGFDPKSFLGGLFGGPKPPTKVIEGGNPSGPESQPTK